MLASSIALGGLAGLLLRGDWRNLRDIEIRWWPLALLALGVRLIGLLVGLPAWAHVVAIMLTAGIAARNWRIAGALFVAAGCLLNATVIMANGGMPYDVAAAVAVGALILPNDALHHPISPETRLPFLADVLPIGLFRTVYSLGDFIIAAGGFWIPFSVLRRVGERASE